MSENLVKKYLEELELISNEQYLDSFFVLDDEWEIYKVSDDTLFYVRFELSEGGIGYAFCVKMTCKKMTWDCDYFCHVKSHGNQTREKWDIEEELWNMLMTCSISILKPF